MSEAKGAIKMNNADKSRFYIDERGGCIAVCDSTLDEFKGNGLSALDTHVVAFWSGESYKDENGYSAWMVPEWAKDKAKALLQQLEESE